MIVLGLTGSIAMGKSTVSTMFMESGVPVWDADFEVHQAYEYDEDIYKFILGAFPAACKNARVDRKILGEIVFRDKALLAELERQFGHYLEMSRARFLANARYAPAGEVPLVVLDIPLLMENPHLIMVCHYVAVVHCTPEEQKARALKRPGMTEERFAAILSNQMPNAEKVKGADIRIDTSKPMLEVRQRVADIIANIADDDWAAKQMFDGDGLLL